MGCVVSSAILGVDYRVQLLMVVVVIVVVCWMVVVLGDDGAWWWDHSLEIWGQIQSPWRSGRFEILLLSQKCCQC